MRTLGTLAALLLLTACSGADPKDEPTAEPLPKVSTATTCGQLFDGDAPVEGVVDLMKKPITEASDAGTARGFADDLEPIREQASEELAPHVDVVMDELRTFADSVDARESYDTGTMVTSLTELNNVCGLTPRF